MCRWCPTLLLTGLCLGAATPASAEEPSVAQVHCVDVEVNGERVRDYACLQRLLAPTPTDARGSAAPLGSESISGRAPSAVGLAHAEATRQRMGNTFGHSTVPQRPASPPAPPPVPAGQR
jgi:hypothetical protein